MERSSIGKCGKTACIMVTERMLDSTLIVGFSTIRARKGGSIGRRMASQFEMSDPGELTYYLGIEVSQGNDCIEIKQERYTMKILKEPGMEDCNPALCPMEPRLKLTLPDSRNDNIEIAYEADNGYKRLTIEFSAFKGGGCG
ncbi:uncharacterized mitochondrial protein-like protein [Tanacetum coccineum]